MQQQVATPGFLAIHPPRRLWPDIQIFSSDNLPSSVKKLRQPQKKPQK